MKYLYLGTYNYTRYMRLPTLLKTIKTMVNELRTHTATINILM